MKPLTSESTDANALHDLGRASVQIIHDLKNQLNGLKLYATFLRKRMERDARPADELETLAKLIAGLERAAADMAVLVRYGRSVDLRRQPRADLARILKAATADKRVEIAAGRYEGEFDAATLTEALTSVTTGARAAGGAGGMDRALEIRLRRQQRAAGKKSAGEDAAVAVIEWRGVALAADDASESDLFHSFTGGSGLRLALAAKIIRAHGGQVEQEKDTLRVRLPLSSDGG